MSNKVYDTLKWITQIALPAILTFFGVVGVTLGLPYTETIVTIGTAGITCLGTCLGISSHNYHKKEVK